MQDQPGYVTQLKWTSTVSNRIILDASMGYSVIFFPTRNQKEVKQGDISLFDITTSVTRVAAATYSFSPADRGAINFNASFFLGKHELKTGYQWDRSMEHSINWNMNDPMGMQARFRDDFKTADSVIQYSTPTESHAYLRENAVFFQDKWQPTRKLTVNFGLRLQKTIGYMPAECHKPTVFQPAACFPAINNVPKWLDLAPRFSAVYDLFGNGRTALKVSANHYDRSIDVTFPRRLSGNSTANRTVGWIDTNGDKIPQLSELDQNPPAFSFGNTNRYAQGIKRPTSDEYSIEVQQELPMNMVFSVSYNRRDNWRGIQPSNVAQSRSAHDPIDITVPAAFGFQAQKVTIWNLRPAFNSLRDNLYENSSGRDTYYNGVDVTASKRMSHHFMLLSGFSYGNNRNRKGGDFNNPNSNWYPGEVVTGNVPVSFKVAGTVEAPFGVELSGNIQYFTGKPEARTYNITRAMVSQQTGKSLTLSGITVPMAAFSTDKLPNTTLADISLRRPIKLERYKFDPRLDIFNLFNFNTITNRITDVSGVYHRVSELLTGRMFRLGFNLSF